MLIQRLLTKIFAGGLIAGVIAFGGIFVWNGGQGSTADRINEDSAQIASVEVLEKEIERD